MRGHRVRSKAAGLLYPPNWLFVALSAASREVPFGIVSAKIIFHFWLACTGLFLYLRRRGLHTAACHAGGAVFVIGYPHLHNLPSALNWNIAWAMMDDRSVSGSERSLVAAARIAIVRSRQTTVGASPTYTSHWRRRANEQQQCSSSRAVSPFFSLPAVVSMVTDFSKPR